MEKETNNMDNIKLLSLVKSEINRRMNARTGMVKYNENKIAAAELREEDKAIINYIEKLEKKYKNIEFTGDIHYNNLPDHLKEIRDQAFANHAFVCVVIPDGCRQIGSGAFANGTALRFVEIPASVEHIAGDAFGGCSEDLIIVTTAGSKAQEHAGQNGICCVIRE